MHLSLTTKPDVKPNPILKQPRSEGRSWLLFAVVVVFLILLAAVRWILAHPYGIHWDEALYFNEALADLHKLHSGSLRQIGSIALGGDPFRPPAYRLFALPFFALFGFHAVIARFVTLAFWLATAGFIYLTSRRMASPVAGAVAVLVFCLAPEVLSDSIFFSTEGPLLLATSAMLYFLWAEESGGWGHRNWIGLGLAIGLGFLSKTTFPLIAFPVLGVVLFLDRRRRFSFQGLKELIKAGALAFIVAAPWWLKNLSAALGYSKFAREQSRESLGAPSLWTSAKWLATVAMGFLGPAITILICLVVIVSLRKILLRKETILSPVQRAAVWACVCAALPFVVLQVSGMNHNLRYLAPAAVPLAVAIGVLADVTDWIRSRAAITASAFLVIAQLFMILTPVAFPNVHPADPGLVNGGLPWGIMVRFDQWDWKPLRDIAQNCELEQPRISLLGMGRPLNPPQISYPWFAEGTSSTDAFFWRSEPVWLWRYSEGPLDWQKVMSAAGESDMVVTAPDFIGQVSDKQDLDNRYNREFATRLAVDSRFQGPIRLEMGRFEPVEVQVFVKKSLVCRQAGEQQAKR